MYEQLCIKLYLKWLLFNIFFSYNSVSIKSDYFTGLIKHLLRGLLDEFFN